MKKLRHRNRNVFNLLSIITLSALTFTSCSNDDDNGTPVGGGGGTPVDPPVTRLYATNNADGNISYYDVLDVSDVSTTTLVTSSTAADGIYYDELTDAVIQASRSDLALEGFLNVSTALDGDVLSTNFTSTTDLQSPRELAVYTNFYVVADNTDVDGDPLTPDGRLFVYKKTGNAFVLRNTITTTFKVWGITFIDNDLYAIMDGTNGLAVFNDFTSTTTDVVLPASKQIFIDGIERTHGITFNSDSNTMILTDIGDAMSATDGGFHVISNFTSKFAAVSNAGLLASADQIRVSGASTLLGNPVDVAFDNESETVYIAEAANGKILGFNAIGAGGDMSPVINEDLPSASAVVLYKE